MKHIENFVPKKILVLQQRQLGDVIVSTPVFSVLRKKYPHAHIALFTEDKCLPLLEYDPNIDSFEILNKSQKQSFFQKIFSPWKTYWNIRKAKYDVIVDLQQLPRCQLVTLFSGALYKLSFTPRHAFKKILYTHYEIPENFKDYISYGKTCLLKPLGIAPSHEKPMLYLTPKEKEQGFQILQDVGITENTYFLTLDATHKHLRRRWQFYKEFVVRFLETYPHEKIFLIRAPGEENQLQELIALDPVRVCMPKKPPTLRESMACMSFANYHVGNTSAPAHMALALGIPALIILSHTAKLWHFDPENPEKGLPKQREVRVLPEKLKKYKAEWKIYRKSKGFGINKVKNTELSNFEPVFAPELNLISCEQAFAEFQKLREAPFY